MLGSSSNLPEKSVTIKQGDKFSSSRLSREIPKTDSPLEVYYGGASVAIPFMWESLPGTPKVKFCETPLHPLTPPPSFHVNSVKKPIKKQSKSNNLLHSILPKLTLRKTHLPPSPASSLSSSSSPSPWSSSHSVPSSPFTPSNLSGQFRMSSPRSSFGSRIDGEDEYGSPISTWCFGICRGANGRSHGFSSRIIKVLLGDFA